MSDKKVPFTFTPVPKHFSKCGWLSHANKDWKNRTIFIYWAFSRCFTVGVFYEINKKKIWLDPFEFACSRRNNNSGLSEQEFRTQVDALIEEGYLIRLVDKSVWKSFSVYKWRTELFSCENMEKNINPINNVVIDESLGSYEEDYENVNPINDSSNPINNPISNPIKSSSQTSESEETKKRQPKKQPNKKPTSIRREYKKNIKVSPVDKSTGANAKGTHSPLSEKENEDYEAIRGWILLNNLLIEDKSLTRWVKKYGIPKVLTNLTLLLARVKLDLDPKSEIDPLSNHEAFMEDALKYDYFAERQRQTINKGVFQGFFRTRSQQGFKELKTCFIHLKSRTSVYFTDQINVFREQLEHLYQKETK